MPRITKVYTRTGDRGDTALASGRRVPKEHLRVEAYGTVDELNSHIGVALSAGVVEGLAQPLARIQNDLFHLGSDLCMPEDDPDAVPVPRIEERHVLFLEELMDRLSEELSPLENFILPGGDAAASHLHVARTVCRRAERRAIEASREETISSHAIIFLNRLSDALFVMARFQNRKSGGQDVIWDTRL
ncbi:MAG: cob(I)yrinic acid a,c-diamide adenosyltransferase [Acidobacteriota bacterium]